MYIVQMVIEYSNISGIGICNNSLCKSTDILMGYALIKVICCAGKRN